MVIPIQNYKLIIKSNVGFKLFGSTESTCEVKFTKNQYYPGEQVEIWLDCDNTKCDKKVKSYKFKLFRQLRCRDATDGNYDTFTKCIKTVKQPGCDAKKREQKKFQFMIPQLEKDCSAEATEDPVNRSSSAILGRDNRLG